MENILIQVILISELFLIYHNGLYPKEKIIYKFFQIILLNLNISMVKLMDWMRSFKKKILSNYRFRYNKIHKICYFKYPFIKIPNLILF